MKEDFLHYIWKHQMFSNNDLSTTTGKKVKIAKPGLHNYNSGPDFLNSEIDIDTLRWVGNVEIHVKSSDWYVHQHEEDINYDSVILHVVWEDDVEVFDVNENAIETIELKSLVPRELLSGFNMLMSKKEQWIPCEKSISEIDSFVFNNWKTRLYFDRLEEKSVLIHELLIGSNNDYEAVLFKLLVKNFGLKKNGEAFFSLANSMSFSVIKKEQNDVLKLSALLFGQAGFLGQESEGNYFKSLQIEYAYLKHKHNLFPISNGQFRFFRMRPTNFPTIRIAQLAALYHKNKRMFSVLMEIKKVEDFYKFFNVDLGVFWKTHYTFQKDSPSKIKRITKSFVDLLLINTIIPLKFNYLKSRGEVDEKEFIELLRQLKPEKNSIISKFSECQIKVENAFDSQALLQMKNNYCAKKLCLQCSVGNVILKKNLV